MAEASAPTRLKKELSLFGVFAIATGTTLSAGFFLLPGLAVEGAGPALALSYLLAAALMVPGMLCIVELSTAMPKAGGAYYFLDRSLGPLAGTVGGVGTWLALTLKTSFALVGMGAYLEVLFNMAPGDGLLLKLIAVGLALLFGALNLLGAKKTGGVQVVLVCGLLAILSWFMADGASAVETTHFTGFLDAGAPAILSTTGLVFISYVGVTNVASVSEEVKDPERNLPRGVFIALGVAVVIYVVGVTVMYGVLGDDLRGSLTCAADAAFAFRGDFGKYFISIGAIFAFSSVANGAILSSSRYPLAMARDHLMPRFLRTVNKAGAPIWSICVTAGAVIAYIIFLDALAIAKLASAFQLLMFSLLCLAVIVMRESQIESYDPGYHSPWYPWLHLFGVVAPFWIIFQMGTMPLLFSSGVVVVGIAWYMYYGRKRVARHGAIYDVFDRLAEQRFYDLDRELRGILKEKGLRKEDPFDESVIRAQFFDAGDTDDFDTIAARAATLLARVMPCESGILLEGFLQGTRTGATPVTGGVALPHMRLAEIDAPVLVLVRSRAGVAIDLGEVFGTSLPTQTTHALFFLVSPSADPGQHLRLLAQLASQVDEPGFLKQWLDAPNDHDLKEILLRNEQYLALELQENLATAELIGKEIRDLELPSGVLVALIRRRDMPLIPRGQTVLEKGDRLTIIGDPGAVESLRSQFDVGLAPGPE